MEVGEGDGRDGAQATSGSGDAFDNVEGKGIGFHGFDFSFHCVEGAHGMGAPSSQGTLIFEWCCAAKGAVAIGRGTGAHEHGEGIGLEGETVFFSEIDGSGLIVRTGKLETVGFGLKLSKFAGSHMGIG